MRRETVLMNETRWNGPYPSGAMREYRLVKRLEAQERNARTPSEHRRSHARRLGYSRNSQIAELFTHASPPQTRRQRARNP